MRRYAFPSIETREVRALTRPVQWTGKESARLSVFDQTLKYGSTATRSNEPFFYCRIPDDNPNTFCSIEPILEPFVAVPEIIGKLDWVIVGAETGNRKKKIVPQKEWIEEIADECKRCRVPIFMKESLRGLMGADFRQELPWEV